MTFTAPPSSDPSPPPSASGSARKPVAVFERSTLALPALRIYMRQLWGRRSLVANLARSQLKAENYDTVLGQIWLILNPLLLAGVYVLVRGVFRQVGSTPMERNAIIANLIMGVFFYRFANSIIAGSAGSILRNKSMVLNTNFPRAVFPLIGVVKAVIEFVPILMVLVAMHAVLGQPFGLSLVTVPVLWLMILIFSLGAGMFFATLTVYLRDTTNILTFVMRLLFFMTPIIYTVDEIPAGLLPYLQFNPLFPVFWALEAAWDGRWPPAVTYLWFGAWMIGAFLVGVAWFISKERSFASRL
ncbi:MAG: ABC transporter permease [Acidimicrobiia bacterium]|nr:ABC transporter permease [Acidimicrobiia bacterium]